MTLAEFRTRVRAYANDPSTGGTFGKTGVNEMYADAALDGIGAEEYKQSCNLLRRHSPGFFVKTLVTATSSTQQNTWPSDFVRLLGPMVVQDQGLSLETDETVGEEVERGTPGIVHGILTANGPRVWLPEQGGFRLYPKVTTAGSKSLLLRYEYIPSFPSTASEAFTWPDNHSTLLVIRTAKTLRETVGAPTSHLRNDIGRLEQDLLVDLHSVDLDTQQFPSSFYDDVYTQTSKQGQVR